MALFRYPMLLAGLALALAALVFFRFRAEEKRRAIARAVLGPAAEKFYSGPGAGIRAARDLLFLAALALAAFAAAGPQWGVELTPVTDLRGNIVVAVDTSLSMAAKDLKPSRLENARLLLGSIAERFADYRVGLIAFAGDAYVQCPLTTDQAAVMYFAANLTPGMLPVQGTDLGQAIQTALGMLSRYGGQKVLVLITDGEDHSKGLEAALAAANEQNMKIFTVGLGNPEGELIPVTDSYGNVMEYKKDKDGKTVVSRLDEAALMKIAGATGAAYLRYAGPEAASEEILKAINSMDLEKSRGKGRANFKNRYQWPLALALLLLLIELVLMEKGPGVNRTGITRFLKKSGGAAAALLLAAALCPRPCAAGPADLARKGNAAYKQENWPKAFEYYSRAAQAAPKDKRMEYNLAASIYKMEEYPKAAEAFESAAKDPELAPMAGYNRAVTLHKSGDLAGAIAGYRAVLRLNPKDENAKFNLQKALEEKKKNEENKDKKKDDKDKDKDKKKDDKDKKGGGGDDKDKQKSEAQKDQEKKKAEARERAKQLLEMMKEKEKESARANQAALQKMKKENTPPNSATEDW